MKSSLTILTFIITTTFIGAQDEAASDVTTNTDGITLKSGAISEIKVNEESYTSTEAPIDELTVRVPSDQDEEQPTKRSPEIHVLKEDEQAKSGDDIESKSAAADTPSESNTTEGESKTNDEKSSDTFPIENQSTISDRIEVNTDLSTGEYFKTGNINEKLDKDGESELQSKNAEEVPADGIGRSADDEGNISRDNIGVEGKSGDFGVKSVNLESLENFEGIDPNKATRRMLFGHSDIIDVKGRSDENVDLDVMRAGTRVAVDSRVAPNTFGTALNQFGNTDHIFCPCNVGYKEIIRPSFVLGSRWNYPSDIIVSHLQQATPPAVAYNPSLIHVQTATVTPQTYNHNVLANTENNRVQRMREQTNSRASDGNSNEYKQGDYHNTLEGATNAYPYVPMNKQNRRVDPQPQDAFSRIQKVTGFSNMQPFPGNFYKPFNANYNAKIYNPYDLPTDRNFQYYHQPLIT